GGGIGSRAVNEHAGQVEDLGQPAAVALLLDLQHQLHGASSLERGRPSLLGTKHDSRADDPADIAEEPHSPKGREASPIVLQQRLAPRFAQVGAAEDHAAGAHDPKVRVSVGNGLKALLRGCRQLSPLPLSPLALISAKNTSSISYRDAA